ncbi:extracellular solute-binding protein, partial [Lachnotalea glycerini]
TVSNYINGKENVNEDKIELIKQAMEELDYRPNYMAQNLKGQKRKIIGILFPNLDEPYNDIYKGLTEYLDMKSFITVLKLTHNNIVLENQFLEQLVNIGAVGIIMVSNDSKNIKKYQQIEKKGVSLVFVERKVEQESFSNILFENKDLVYDITSSLLEKDKECNIKLLLGKQEFSNERDCAEGYLAAREARQEDIIIIKEINREAIFDRIYQSIMSFEPKPEHIITSSVEFAQICAEACNILHADICIHALAGEKWYMTELQKNVIQYGRNAILMGKQAGKKMNEMLSNRNLPEKSTIYVKSKKKYGIQESNNKSYANHTIRILAYRCDATNALKKLAASFKQSYGIHVEFHELEYTKLRGQLELEFQTQSKEYDIYMLDLPWLRSVLAGNVLTDMSKKAKEDNLLSRYPRTILDAFYKGDRGVHIFPIIATTQVLLYRKDIFSNPDIKAQFMRMYGFDLSVPNTWSNFNTIAEFFDRKCNPKSPFEYGTAATALEPIGLINEFIPRQWAFYGKIVDRWGKVIIDSDENVKALENLVTTFEHIPTGTEEYFWDDIFELLLKGKIPMAHGFASHYQPGKYSLEGDTYEKYIGAVPVPGYKPMLGGWALGINKFSKHVDECYEFIKWNLNDKIAISNMRLCGCVPITTVFQDDTLKVSYPWLNMVNERIELGHLREEILDTKKQIINTEAVDKVISCGIKKAILKEENPVDALDKVKKELNKLIAGE